MKKLSSSSSSAAFIKYCWTTAFESQFSLFQTLKFLITEENNFQLNFFNCRPCLKVLKEFFRSGLKYLLYLENKFILKGPTIGNPKRLFFQAMSSGFNQSCVQNGNQSKNRLFLRLSWW